MSCSIKFEVLLYSINACYFIHKCFVLLICTLWNIWFHVELILSSFTIDDLTFIFICTCCLRDLFFTLLDLCTLFPCGWFKFRLKSNWMNEIFLSLYGMVLTRIANVILSVFVLMSCSWLYCTSWPLLSKTMIIESGHGYTGAADWKLRYQEANC